MLFLYEKFILPGKDAEMSSLRQEKEKLQTDLQREDRENDNLRNQNALLQSSHDEKSFPLKKRAQILAKQIDDFANQIHWPPTDMVLRSQQYNEWSDRFAPRVQVMLKQLDELGQHSDFFETNNYGYLLMNYAPDEVKQLKSVASELNRLADKLPDVESP